MEIIIQRVLAYLLCQLVAALIASGFVLGFAAFLALATGFGLLAWFYWRYVVCRPSSVVVAAFGDRYYYMDMEVA